MNRLDPVSGQLVAGHKARSASGVLRAATWTILAGCFAAAAVLGALLAGNPTDAAARSAALVPLLLLVFDGWALAITLLRGGKRSPLRVPTRTPVILAVVHLLAGVWAHHLSSFDGLYRLQPIADGAGAYEVGWWPALLLCGLAAVSLSAAVLQARMVDRVLISEKTSAAATAPTVSAADEPDVPLGHEHVYEAQVLLNNLGYGVDRIDGELGKPTRSALDCFQAEADLPRSGQVTALTMIELRNRWAAQGIPRPGQNALAVGNHVLRRLAGWVKLRRAGGGGSA